MKYIKKMVFSLLAGVMIFGGTLTVNAAGGNPFADVKENDWYYPYVIYALQNNFMSGKDTNENGLIVFDPLASITRAEFVQSLYSKEGKPDVEITTMFSDVKDTDWFAEAVSWAAANGIVAGKGDYFDVNAPITREEVAAILYQYADKRLGYSVKGSTELTSFADADKVSGWATDKLKWAIHHGIMAGKSDNVAPKASATRAECATMLKSFVAAYTDEYTSIGMHDFEWIVTKEPSEETAASVDDFGSRTYTCSSCGAKKITEVMVNNGNQIVCGVFDDKDADVFMQLANKARRLSYSGESDTWGNHIGWVCPPTLVETEELNTKAKLRAAQIIDNYSAGFGELLADGHETAGDAHVAWQNQAARTLINVDFSETGGACFWYDRNDTGKDLWPYRVQVFGGEGLGPVEPDEESRTVITNDENGIPDVAFYQTALEKYDRNGNGELSYGEAARTGVLDLSDKGISDIRGIEYFTGATKIDFSNNQISDLIPLAAMTDLYWEMNFSNNNISDLSVFADINVLELFLAKNQITDISPLHREYMTDVVLVDSFNYFTELDLGENAVTNLVPLKGMHIQYLNLSDNGISDIRELKDMLLYYNYGLNLSHNNLTDISVLDGFGTDRTSMNYVDYIDLSHNQLKTLNGTIQAEKINLSYNQLTSITNGASSAKELAAWGILDVSHNQLTDLTPAANKVGYLDASYNNISSVAPLKNTSFCELNLSHNNISDVSDLATMTMYEMRSAKDTRLLDITYNNIVDLSPLKDSTLMNSIVARIQYLPQTVLVGSEAGEITRKDISIAEGNQITMTNAQANLPEELLDSALYLGGQATLVNWLDTEAFAGKTVDTSKKGLVLEEDRLVYYKEGVCDYSFVGMASYEGNLYYVQNGVVDTTLSGLFYVLDSGFKRFISQPGSFYIGEEEMIEIYVIKEGALDVKYTGAVDMDFNTVADKYDLNYYYVTNGVFDKTYTGVGVYEQSTGYVTNIPVVPRYFTNGCYDTSFDGVVVYENYSWKLTDGFYAREYTGLAKGDDRVYRWYFEGIFTEETVITTNPDDGEAYLAINGVVDTTYTGVYKLGDMYYYIVNGRVDYTYTGVYEELEDGSVN